MATNKREDESQNNLDYVLNEIGDFSGQQIWKFLWIGLPIALSATFAITFVVTATNLDYRCRVPKCDMANDSAVYDTDWLSAAIPADPKLHGRSANCLRYGSVNASTTINGLKTGNQCSANMFNRSQTIKCHDFVFKSNERRLLQQFNLYCEENEYKLAMVGMISNLGGSLFKPFIGILSDKYGRLKILIIGMLGNSALGIAKAFSTNYYMFLTLEFIEMAIGTCIFTAAFVLCAEWVTTKNRVLSCTICLLYYPLGEILLGLLGMYVPSQRVLLLSIYVPGLLIIFYYRWIPESVRWLVATGQRKRALAILRASAAANRSHRGELTQQSEDIVYQQCKVIHDAGGKSRPGDTADDGANENLDGQQVNGDTTSITAIFRSRTLVLRLLNCCIVWIVCTKLFFGLTYSSAQIQGDNNKYLSFILVVCAKMPAAICTYNLLDRMGRRTTLCTGLIIVGLTTVATALIPVDQTLLIRICFFTGMLSIAVSLSTLFIYTAEMWPTSTRNTLLNFCATTGRIGAVLAPLTPLLAHVFPSLPYLTFGTIAILTGLLVLLLPETLRKKLPDTIDEAINL